LISIYALYTVIIGGIAISEIQCYQDEIAQYLADQGKKRDKKKNFYSSSAWKNLRYKVLDCYEATCMCCGASRESGDQIDVDHILPRSLYPHLALDFDNMAVLCHSCNAAKSNTTFTDWRTKKEKECSTRKAKSG
jgi:5-methylcytosine-specific restriction endonuclease McrA